MNDQDLCKKNCTDCGRIWCVYYKPRAEKGDTEGGSMTELKPCPFCGGEVKIIRTGGDYEEPIFDYYMITRGGGKNGCRCRLFMESDRFSSKNRRLARIAKANLIEAWNRREV